jgi:hypothetical protein
MKFHVRNCNVCLDEECTSHAEVLADLRCGACGNPASVAEQTCLGDVQGACSEHEPYLDGWVRDIDHEIECESRAARDFEYRSYGRRDD